MRGIEILTQCVTVDPGERAIDNHLAA
jgi:hypothetical protein